MRKIFCLISLFFFILYGFSDVFSNKSLNIISRNEWGAIEEYRFIDSIEWKKIISDENIRLKKENKYISDKETVKFLQKPDYNEKIENYLSTFFGSKRIIGNIILQENDRKLFWPIAQSKNIQSIVIHHTAWDYTDSYKSVRDIYKFHTLDRKWGDIGYNFLISDTGEVFEGRAGGETAVAAHNKWNNIGNIGIALMGNYKKEHIPEKQIEALNILSSYLIEKYDIDLNKKVYFHEECKKKDCEKEIYSELDFPIIAHRDSSNTTCPGDTGYEEFLIYKNNILKKYKIPEINILKLEYIFDKYSQNHLNKLLNKLVVLKHKEINYKKKKLFQEVIFILENYLTKNYI